MAGVYRPRHPERTVLYRVLFHYFDRSDCGHSDIWEPDESPPPPPFPGDGGPPRPAFQEYLMAAEASAE